MKAIHWMIAALGLAFVLPAPADAAQSDPEVIIYRFPGVKDNGGGDNVGVATVFHCTNFSGVVENVRIVVRNGDSVIKANQLDPVPHLNSQAWSTHGTNIYGENILATGSVDRGTAAIAATSVNVVCTAVTISASATEPVGFALRGIRFNPAPGSQE
jgi:hypothetical protein